MKKFDVECELMTYHDPKISGAGVKFDYRFDGHYVTLTVTAGTYEGAVRKVLDQVEDVDGNGSFFVTAHPLARNLVRCYTFDDDGEVVRDTEF